MCIAVARSAFVFFPFRLGTHLCPPLLCYAARNPLAPPPPNYQGTAPPISVSMRVLKPDTRAKVHACPHLHAHLLIIPPPQILRPQVGAQAGQQRQGARLPGGGALLPRLPHPRDGHAPGGQAWEQNIPRAVVSSRLYSVVPRFFRTFPNPETVLYCFRPPHTSAA